MKNILLNLLINAIKFSPEDGIINLSVEIKENNLNITIKDSGIGISKSDQEHLFSSFYRASNAINIQGTGLGLHIVKRYTDILQGTVSLNSEIEKGTTVYLILPELEN